MSCLCDSRRSITTVRWWILPCRILRYETRTLEERSRRFGLRRQEHRSTCTLFRRFLFGRGDTKDSIVDEGTLRSDPAGLRVGYSQTKWVADTLVRRASDRGLRATIYRVGRISGHSQTGMASRSDIIARFVQACVRLRAAPATEREEGLAPVDLVASGIVRLSLRSSTSETFHIENGKGLRLIAIAQAIRDFGYDVEPVSAESWLARLHDQRVDRDDSTVLLSSMFPKTVAGPMGPGRSRKYDSNKSQKALENVGVVFPSDVATLVTRSIEYFVRKGYLPPPPAGSPRERKPTY